MVRINPWGSSKHQQVCKQEQTVKQMESFEESRFYLAIAPFRLR